MRRLSVVVLVLFLALTLLTPAALADHPVGPCTDLGNDPGNSGYAKHHIVAFAHLGLLGQGHKPGTHQGFSTCL